VGGKRLKLLKEAVMCSGLLHILNGQLVGKSNDSLIPRLLWGTFSTSQLQLPVSDRNSSSWMDKSYK